MLEICSYPPVPDYEEEVRRQRSLNVALFRKSLNTSKTKKKLENYAARFGHEFETVWYRAKVDPLFAEQFAIDPQKQGIHQKLAFNYLRGVPGVEDAVLLRNDELWLPVEEPVRSKSVDFKWVSHGFTCYVSHKYTREEGGAQDNQYEDLKRFVEDGCRVRCSNAAVVVIADGAFYTQRGRLRALRELGSGSWVPLLVTTVPTFVADWSVFESKLRG